MTDTQLFNPARLGEEAELVLPGWRRAVFPAACLACVLGGFSLVQADPPQPVAGWTLSAMAGGAGVTFLAWVGIGRRLRVVLDRQGFTVIRLLSTRRYAWSEVSEFAIAGQSAGRGARLAYVVFNADRGTAFARWLNRFLTGRTQMMPVGLVLEDGTGDAVVVTALLNAWRDRALKARR